MVIFLPFVYVYLNEVDHSSIEGKSCGQSLVGWLLVGLLDTFLFEVGHDPMIVSFLMGFFPSSPLEVETLVKLIGIESFWYWPLFLFKVLGAFSKPFFLAKHHVNICWLLVFVLGLSSSFSLCLVSFLPAPIEVVSFLIEVERCHAGRRVLIRCWVVMGALLVVM